MLELLTANKEWIFSGAGFAVMGMVMTLGVAIWKWSFRNSSPLSQIPKKIISKQNLMKQSNAGVVGDGAKIDTINFFNDPAHLANQTNLDDDIRTYCRKADALHNFIPLVGFKTRLKVPMDLEKIYVPLRAVVDMRSTGQSCFGDAEDADTFFKECGQGQEIPLTQAFEWTERLKRTGIILLGDPGSGKTTHLKRLLLWCLRGGLEELGLPKDMIPVFLPLRELKDVSKGLDSFIQEQLNQRHLQTPSGFGQRMLDRGNLLLLFDGLDEVADPVRRAKVSRWIAQARTLHPTCYFVVTCRFAGYAKQVQMDAPFLEMHLRPLDKPQAEEFIRNWYGIVESAWVSDKDQAASVAGEKAQKLIQLLEKSEFRSRKVFQLTRNPLLLTNLCLIHRDRGNLPRSRGSLYEECIDVLLELWRDAIDLPSRVDAATGKRVLQPAALWLHREDGRTRASADELSPVMDPVIKAVQWSHGSAEDFLAAVKDESGLLTGWGDGTYGFMHLGFQEYLTAREIRNKAFQELMDQEDSPVLGTLAAHFHESWWQEVGLLLVSLNEPSLFVPFMRKLVNAPVFLSRPDLIDICLDDAAEVSTAPFVELISMAPGNDPEFWQRQRQALELVKRIDLGVLETLMPGLESHPDDTIRNWLKNRTMEKKREEIVAPKGEYTLVWIPGDTFMMGSPETDKNRQKDEGPVHEVQVKDFYMGKYPVTNEEYGRFLGENPNTSEPKHWADRAYNQPKQPVVGVSWEDATTYAQWSGLELPSEAQWEYACRANTQTRFYTGDLEEDLDRAGWYTNNSDNRLHPVGEKIPNGFGLYDMHGNVHEWVHDHWHDNYEGAPDDGSAWVDGGNLSARVIRGGSWDIPAGNCRAAYRRGSELGRRGLLLGFRLVLPGQPQDR